MRDLVSEAITKMSAPIQSMGIQEGSWEELVGPSTVGGGMADVAMPCHSHGQ